MIYLDNAATSFPKPPEVYAAPERCLRELGANPGRAAYRMAVATKQMLEETRRLLAELIGARSPDRVVLTFNATDSLNMAIKGVLAGGAKASDTAGAGFDTGDTVHVVTSRLEHNSVTRPLNRLEQAGRIRVTPLEPDTDGVVSPDRVREALRDDTRLVALTHCSNVVGTIQPIAEIGEVIAAHNLRTCKVVFLVDAAQTAGVVPLDVEAMRVDLLAFSGHKGLMGPPGTGGLYVREGIDLTPWREGGTGDDSASPMQPDEMPYRLEAGTPNTVGLFGLGVAARFVHEQGVENILRHEQDLVARLLDGLAGHKRIALYGSRDPRRRTGVLSFNLKGMEPQEVALILEQSFDIAVRAGLHCAPDAHRWLGTFPNGAVRVSPGWFNTNADIDALVSALREIAGSLD